jgi:autotransporter-associated beta strand protein
MFLAGSANYTVSSNNTVTLADSIGGGTDPQITGGFTKSGGGNLILSGQNSYTGGTTVTAGRLSVNGSIIGNVEVASTATLGGTGTASGAITVDGGGTIAPGNSIGTLNIGSISLTAAGAAYNPEIDLTNLQADLLNVTGTVSLGGGTLNLSLPNVADPSTIVLPQTFEIIANDGNDAVSGTFGTINVPSGYIAIVNTAFTGTDALGRIGDGNDVAVTISAAVPEPISLGVMAISGLLTLRRRRAIWPAKTF